MKKSSEYHKMFTKWREMGLYSAVFGGIGLALTMLNYEYDVVMFKTKLEPSLIPNAMDDVRNAKSWTNTIRIVIFLTTIMAIICLIMRHHYKIEWFNKYFQDDSETAIYCQYNEIIMGRNSNEVKHRKRLFRRNLFMEIAMLMVCPIPFFDMYITLHSKDKKEVYILLSDIILAFMLVRTFFLVRTCVNYTVYTDAYSKKLCKSYGFDAGVRFTFKCMILESPGLTFFLTFSISVFLQTYMLRIFEMPYFRTIATSDSNFEAMDAFFNSLWCVIITMTTVGYGDIAPSTMPGRSVAMVVALYGAFLISLLVATMSSFIELNTS